MNFPKTLSLYLARQYALNLIVLLLGLLAIVYLFDTVELIRRAEKRDDVSLLLVLQMGVLKLPEVGQVLLPFGVLFGAIFTFWQLSKRSELIVVRSSGFSVWQFLAPIALVAVSAGLLQMAIINPIGALLVGKFEQWERMYLSKHDNQIALFREGLWMRQIVNPKDNQNLQSIDDGYVILHAVRIDPKAWILHDVFALYFNHKDKFLMRVDAPKAYLNKGHWLFEDSMVHKIGHKPDMRFQYILPTILTPEDIEESFASSTSMSFWGLPDYIKTLERTGFDATRLRVHYQMLIAQPLFFLSMVLLAASVSMRPSRFHGSFGLIVMGVAVGFLVFFLVSFLQALGASGQIPVILAAWSAPMICFLLGVGMMLYLEDG